jgi:hypothetical protein
MGAKRVIGLRAEASTNIVIVVYSLLSYRPAPGTYLRSLKSSSATSSPLMSRSKSPSRLDREPSTFPPVASPVLLVPPLPAILEPASLSTLPPRLATLPPRAFPEFPVEALPPGPRPLPLPPSASPVAVSPPFPPKAEKKLVSISSTKKVCCSLESVLSIVPSSSAELATEPPLTLEEFPVCALPPAVSWSYARFFLTSPPVASPLLEVPPLEAASEITLGFFI